jgi:hypothetical protein
MSGFGPSFMPDVPDWFDAALSPFHDNQNLEGNQ